MVMPDHPGPKLMTAMLLDMVDIPLHQIISPLFFNEISMKNHHENPQGLQNIMEYPLK